ncbi:hypothetical protein OS493_022764 [Desmophyllum pertusum]|uniref:Uncharacterized protein n=1 Tax=Desmophyllum pertusum TaxID=174260 RepID=A0A9X0CFX8_9CNID|nr:hypothetical protein OS493_022764 [Desmophyllum pertusum]
MSGQFLLFVGGLIIPKNTAMVHHEPEPESESTAEPESEPKTLLPEIMTNQEAFLMYGIFIFALAVFCVVLLVLFIIMKKQVRSLNEKMYGQGHMQMGLAEKKGYVA